MKKTLLLTVAVLFAVSLMFGLTPGEVAADQTFVTIGTGGVTGVYYPTGGAICRLVNKGRKEHGIRCSVESTGGSVYNLNTIAAGELDMGVAQSDWQYHAYNGTAKFAEAGAQQVTCGRSFPYIPNPLPSSPGPIPASRISRTSRASGSTSATPAPVNAAPWKWSWAPMGWTKDDFKLASELKSAEQSAALCDNKVDAMVFTVGHPSGSIKEATTSCDSVLVNVTGPEIDKLVEDNDYYRKATIPGGMYRGTDADTKTFGVGATFVTSANVPEDVIYNVVKAVFENFDEFKKLHPAFEI